MKLPSVNTGLKRYKGKWNNETIKHLLKRTMFGARKLDIDYFNNKSLKKAIAELIETTEPLPLPPLNTYVDAEVTDAEIPIGKTWINANEQTGQLQARRRNSTRIWWFGLMLNQNKTINEKMVLFWHNHFATEMDMIGNATWAYKHHIIIRENALGNFKQLVRAITFSPGMLKYLNGLNNVKKAPDENYGRELQELFTMGKGPDSKYTENDVKAAAKVLSGLRIENKVLSNAHSYFDEKRHDDTDKQFSSFYNNTVIKGRKGKEGEQEIDELLAMLFAQEECAKFICRKLYRYFVYHVIDEQTEQNIIRPLADTFRKNDYEIKPVLKQLLSSEHFFDIANRGSIIKSPIDYIVGLCRECNVVFPTNEDYIGQYKIWQGLQQLASQMQQNIGDPPNVAGWPAYYQEPVYNKLWINSDTLPKRNQFADKMVTGGITRNAVKIMIDVVAFAATLNNPSDPEQLINESIQLLYMMDISDKEKKYLKEGILLSGLQGMQSDHYWTDAWNKLTTNPEDEANKKDVTNKLKKLYQYLMDLPFYQLC